MLQTLLQRAGAARSRTAVAALLLAGPAAALDVGAVADPDLPLPGALAVPDPNTAEALSDRRARLAVELGDGLLLLGAGEEVHGRFEAHDDFHYLAGVDVPGAVLALRAEEGEVALERLYLPERSEREALWEGPLLGPGEEARARTGAAETRALDELEDDLDALLADAGTVYALDDQREELLEGRELELESPRQALNALQAVKSDAELAALQAAVDVTLASLADAFVVARPGAYEFMAEAAIEGGFRRRGAPFRAFPSICGSGPSACVLHYRDNARRIQPGELLLMDVGAKVHGYSADVTRTIPVDGTFTPRQRELYELVARAHDAAAAALEPGVTLRDAHAVARGVFEEADLAHAFKHSVGHHLGVRVHDVPGYRGPLAPGMVVTIEPGLYLPEEATGIRIENDYVITEDGARLLSGALPYHADELESYLARIRAGG